jgi:Fis family transcriptional regulator
MQTCTSLRQCVEAALEQYFAQLGEHRQTGLYDFVLREVELPLLQAVLRHTRGNQSRAAAVLGMNRATLRKRMRSYGLE